MSNCACGSEVAYKECCEPFHKGEKFPKTAKDLMKARYSAFANNEIDFIAGTHVPGTKDFDMDEAREWATNSTWKGLEIIKTQTGEEADEEGLVEFKAHYSDKDDKDYLHHEVASFKKIKDKWYFENGQIVGTGPLRREGPKVGRNDPCPCESGKKFKKCCGA